jgi:CBS domain containing-hemolysin-like protein
MPSLTLESTCGEAVEKLKASGASCLAVCDANGKAIGIMPATDLMTRLAKRKVTLSDNVAYICLKVFRSVSGHMPVSELLVFSVVTLTPLLTAKMASLDAFLALI